MKNTKKKINKVKTDNFLEKFPILFLLQQTNFTVNDWFNLKHKIRELSENSSNVKILNIKNNILKQSLSPEIYNSLNFLLQGPNFLIGCNNENQSKLIWSCIQSYPKLIFISCLYKNQLLNHLDFESFLKLDNSIYKNLIFQLDKKTELYHTLQHNLTLQPVTLIQQNLITCLSTLKLS